MTISFLINSIDAHLKENKLRSYANELKNLNIDSVLEFISFNRDTYNKVILHQEDRFEVILICWLPNQKTPFHQHPKNGCLMKVFNGPLKDIRKIEGKTIETIVPSDHITYIEGGETHMISNMQEKAISIHIYSPGKFYN